MDGLERSTAVASQPFTFVWLEERIVEYTKDSDEAATTLLERCAMIGAIAIGGLGILTYLLLRNRLGQQVLQVTVLLEWCGAVLIYVRAGYRAWRAYKRQYVDFARDLDDLYVRYRTIINDLQSYPASEIAKHLRYIHDRKATLIYRHALLSGGMEKIGILPLLALMYLQLKDWSFGSWKDLLDQVHLVGGFLLWMLLITYLIAWWAARIKGRLDVYEALLAETGVARVEESVLS